MGHFAIIPKPKKIQLHPDSFFVYPDGKITFPLEGRQAAGLLSRITGLDTTSPGRGIIHFVLDNTIKGVETYRLNVDPSGIVITASTPAGLFYGAQTLRQLLPAEVEQKGITAPVELPCISIEDEPRFAYRGMMLDVSRHFFGPSEIKRIIDLLALQKINRFHWHLTDDQGWRIEIKKFPLLTDIGSKRKETQVGGWLLSKPVYDGIP